MFSVLIPVFNHGRFLRQAVESAVREPLVGEVLLVDDGSRDGSERVIRELCRCYSAKVRDIGDGTGENRGAHVRLNELAGAARNDWLAVLNSDDAFVPSRFALARTAITAGSCEFVSGSLLVMDRAGAVFGRKRGWRDPEYPFPSELPSMPGSWQDPAWQEAFRGRLLNQNFIATTSNMVFTRRLHESLGGFRAYRYCHDWDFALRAAFAGDIAWCDQYLTMYRIHDSNTIAESADKVRAEVRTMFHRLIEDGCVSPSSRAASVGLEFNAYLRAA